MYRSRWAVEIERTSAKLSKLPSAVSSPGSSGLTSRLSANRSRIALLYSARFRRWTALILPGFGLADDARSIAVSSQLVTARAVAASGRGIPGGGIEPARSLAMTRSHFSALAIGLARSKLSSASPAVWSFWLWHPTQCESRNARGSVAGDVAGAPKRPAAAAAPAKRSRIFKFFGLADKCSIVYTKPPRRGLELAVNLR